MNCNHDIFTAQVFRQHVHWSGFQSPVDTGIIVLLG